MVIRSSLIIPEMRSAYFNCNICGFHTEVEIDRGRIVEPNLCPSCNTLHSFELLHNRSLFSDKQYIKLQETPGIIRVRPNFACFCSFWIHRTNACGSNAHVGNSSCTQWSGRCSATRWSVNDYWFVNISNLSKNICEHQEFKWLEFSALFQFDWIRECVMFVQSIEPILMSFIFVVRKISPMVTDTMNGRWTMKMKRCIDF